MDLTTQIKELERKLHLKKAFEAVRFTFGKGYKSFPADVRDEVENALHAYALQQAETDQSEKPQEISSFSAEELEALKVLAQTVLKRKTTTSEPTKRPPPSPPKETGFRYVTTDPTAATDSVIISAPTTTTTITTGTMNLVGTLLLLDNLHPSQRNKVDSGARVNVIESRDSKYLVRDQRGNQFWIPQDDIELS